LGQATYAVIFWLIILDMGVNPAQKKQFAELWKGQVHDLLPNKTIKVGQIWFQDLKSSFEVKWLNC
jgi:hypothetical protein